jgi:hypothetical protein
MEQAMHELIQHTEFSPANHVPTDEVLTNLVEALQSALAHAAASPAVLQALREVHRIQTAAAEAVTLSTISDSVASAFRLAPVDLTNSRKRDARTAMARKSPSAFRAGLPNHLCRLLAGTTTETMPRSITPSI